MRYRLRDDTGRQLWKDHPSGSNDARGIRVDVAALPIIARPRVRLNAFPIETAHSIAHPTVAAPISVIGFPRGIGAAGNWPIWITGTIATDPHFDFDQRPVLLIDAQTREGMTGSPVVARTTQARATKPAGLHLVTTHPAEKFLGIYAGRRAKDLDLGYRDGRGWAKGPARMCLHDGHGDSEPRADPTRAISNMR